VHDVELNSNRIMLNYIKTRA